MSYKEAAKQKATGKKHRKRKRAKTSAPKHQKCDAKTDSSLPELDENAPIRIRNDSAKGSLKIILKKREKAAPENNSSVKKPRKENLKTRKAKTNRKRKPDPVNNKRPQKRIKNERTSVAIKPMMNIGQICHLIAAVQTVHAVCGPDTTLFKPNSELKSVIDAYNIGRNCINDIKKLMKTLRIDNALSSFERSWNKICRQFSSTGQKLFEWGEYGNLAILKNYAPDLLQSFNLSYGNRARGILLNLPDCPTFNLAFREVNRNACEIPLSFEVNKKIRGADNIIRSLPTVYSLSSVVIHAKAHFYTLIRAGPTSDQFIIANDSDIGTIPKEEFEKLVKHNACAVTYIKRASKHWRYRHPESAEAHAGSNRGKILKDNDFIVWGPHMGMPMFGLKCSFVMMGLTKFAWSLCKWEGDRHAHTNCHVRVTPKSRLTREEFRNYAKVLRRYNWRVVPANKDCLVEKLLAEAKPKPRNPADRKEAVHTVRNRKRPSRQYTIRIGSWNVHSINTPGKFKELEMSAKQTDCHLIALQETCQHTGTIVPEMEGYEWLTSNDLPNKSVYGEGVAFLISDVIAECWSPIYSEIPKSQWGELKLDGGSIIIGNIYMPTCKGTGNQKIYKSRLQEIDKFIKTLKKARHPKDIILLGDFNARLGRGTNPSDVIGTNNLPETNSHGEILKPWLAKHSLSALNGRTPSSSGYTFESKINNNIKSTLDLVVTNNISRCTNMVIHREVPLTDGDHLLVTADIPCIKPRRKKRKAAQIKIRYDLLAAKDGVLRHIWRNKIENNRTTQWADTIRTVTKKHAPSRRIRTLTQNVTDFIPKITAEVCGTRKCVQGRSKSWWNDSCKEMWEKKNTAVMKSKNTHKQEDIENAKVLVKEWRTHMRKCIATQRIKEVEEIIEAFSDDSANFWGLIRKFMKKHGKSTQNIKSMFINGKDGPCTNDDDEIVNILRTHAKKLATPQQLPHFKEDFYQDICEKVKNLPYIPAQEQDGPITVEEVTAQRKKLRKGKAAGLDGIRPEMLKYGKEVMDKYLQPLFDMCFEHMAIHDDLWRKAKVISLFKAVDTRAPTNYRGISLLSVLGKLYASVLNARLTKFLETPVQGKRRISTHQNGFRTGEGRSCQEHILSLSEVLRQRKRNNQDSYVFFQDFSKAFDLVDHKCLEYKLHQIGVTGKLRKNIMRLYKNMTAACYTNGKLSEEYQVQVGTAQGCPLSPALFNVFVQDLIDLLNESNHSKLTLAYADDIVVVSDSAEGLQQIINICAIWTGEWRMKANVTKSAVMEISANGQELHEGYDFIYTYNGEELPKVPVYKYLGILFDENVDFNPQIRKRKAACKQRLGALKAVIKLQRLPLKIKQRLVDASVTAAMRYGVEVWGWGHDKELDIISNNCSRSILGLPSSGPNTCSGKGARAISGLQSLRTIRDIAASKLITKCQNQEADRLPHQHTGANSFIRQQLQGSPIFEAVSAAGPNSLKSENLKRTLNEIQTEIRDQDTATASRDLSLLEIRQWASEKENESNRDRNSLRVGCSCIHDHINNLERLESDNKKKHYKKNGRKKRKLRKVPQRSDTNRFCPMCNEETTSPEHALFSCKNKTQTATITKTISQALRDTGSGFVITQNNCKAVAARILAPEFWTTTQNQRINSHCSATLRRFELAKQIRGPRNAPQPILIELLERNSSEEELLNRNIINEVINYKISDGPHKGTWRMRITDYDPFANRFALDSTGLDICDQLGNWFSFDTVDLNDELAKGYVEFQDKNNLLRLNTNIRNTIRRLFDSNIVGKQLEIKTENELRYAKATVKSYHQNNGTHEVVFESHNHQGRGASKVVDLNKLALCDHIRLSSLPQVVVQRWRAIAGRFGSHGLKGFTVPDPQLAEVPARPMPEMVASLPSTD